MISSPLKNKAERGNSWLSGSFYKQCHDRKHMASLQHQKTGSSAAPWRSISPVTLLLHGPLDVRHPTLQPELMGRLTKLVTWEQTEPAAETLAWCYLLTSK